MLFVEGNPLSLEVSDWGRETDKRRVDSLFGTTFPTSLFCRAFVVFEFVPTSEVTAELLLFVLFSSLSTVTGKEETETPRPLIDVPFEV